MQSLPNIAMKVFLVCPNVLLVVAFKGKQQQVRGIGLQGLRHHFQKTNIRQKAFKSEMTTLMVIFVTERYRF